MKTLIVGALAMACIAPAVAQASSPENGPATVAIRYSDLNLNQTSDARIMLSRIRDAALNACGADATSLSDYRLAVRSSACYTDGVRQAVVDLNAPAVTSLYNHRPSVTVASN